MNKLSQQSKFFLELAKVHTILSRKLDGRLGGLSLSEFMILYTLYETPEERLRRIDLAEHVGLTASGITRILLPMEKIGLVKKETNERDARSSFVLLAPGGKEMLIEAIDRADLFAKDVFPPISEKKLEEISKLFQSLGKV